MNIPEPIAKFIVENFILSIAILSFLWVQLILLFNWVVKKIFCKKMPKLHSPQGEPLLKEPSTGGVTSPQPPVENKEEDEE